MRSSTPRYIATIITSGNHILPIIALNLRSFVFFPVKTIVRKPKLALFHKAVSQKIEQRTDLEGINELS